MPKGETSDIDDVLKDIAALLASAYTRRARMRLVPPSLGALLSTEELANLAEPSVHELTLTGQRRESKQQ